MQFSELLKKAGLEGSLKDLPNIHHLVAVWPSWRVIYPEWVSRTAERDAVSFEVITTSKEIILTLTRLEQEQLYHLLSFLGTQIQKEVGVGKSEAMVALSLNGKTFMASEVETLIHGRVVIRIS